jgi:thioredoxin reductase (NADPH)
VIVASGAQPRKLDVPGEKRFLTRGVSYCATCDGAFFREKDIIVVGGGDTAVEEALYLTRFGKKVTIVHRRDRLRASKVLQERAMKNEKIDFVWKKTVREIRGEDNVSGVVIEDVDTGQTETMNCDGVFIFVGWVPNTDFVPTDLELNNGSIVVDKNMRTSCPGVFAAGDCCQKDFRQIVTACGDGANAAHEAQLYVERLKGTAYE